LVHERVEGVVVEDYAAGEVSESELAALAVKMPLIMTSPYAARAGVLFTYGVNMVDLTRKSAEYVARLLGGARPSDLPVQLPTKFEFVINLKTAESLGLQIPRALLLRADQLVR
jgi:putative ABC transport system substrate-binding protein